MLSRVVAASPTECPVDIDMLRRHCKIDGTQDDPLLQAYGTAATEIAENATNRYFLQRSVQWVLTPDTRQTVWFSLAVTLQNYFNTYQRPWLHCPDSAISVDSMSIGNWGEADTVLVLGQDYEVDISTDPARVRLLNFEEFDPEVDHLTINYTSGFGSDPADIPMPIMTAICLLTMKLWEQRGEQETGLWSAAVDSLLAPYVVYQFAASSDLYNA